MVTFREGVKKAAKEVLCAWSANEVALLENLARAYSGIPGLGSSSNAALENATAFRNLACDIAEPPGGFPPIEPALGQCPGVTYRITGTAEAFRASNPSDSRPPIGVDTTVTGPIESIELTRDSNNYFVRVDAGGTVVFANIGNVVPGYGELRWVSGPFITRPDGLPDDCGPDDGYRPPVEYDPPGGAPVVENPIVVVLPPVINVNAPIFIPLIFDFGGFSLNVRFDITTGDIIINPLQPGEGGGNCCAPLEPVLPDLPPVDEEPPPPTTTSRFDSVVVIVVGADNSPATQIGDSNSPILFVPRIATISFAIEFSGRRTWTVDVPIKKTTQLVEVPGNILAYDWGVFIEPGVTSVNVFPNYVQPVATPPETPDV